ncbi:MAG TPA: hypothetical protein VFA65_24525 [Bryobacteraceae bacterium]|nr:hypothetical protein [Bryobacteraceae bacterium]
MTKIVTWDIVPVTKFRIVRCETTEGYFGEVPLRELPEAITFAGEGGSVDHIGEFDTERRAAEVMKALQKEELAQIDRGVAPLIEHHESNQL